MPKVFLSHSSGDCSLVERVLVPLLNRHGVDTWYCRDDIRTAAAWERNILQGLEECDWFLVVLSPRSVASEWVKDEVHWAVEHRPGRIVPLLVEECAPHDLHIRLARLQYVDFCGDRHEACRRLLAVWGKQIAEGDILPSGAAAVDDGLDPDKVSWADWQDLVRSMDDGAGGGENR